MAIGIFDSGLGGLTVAKAIMEALPRENIVYFGDTARTPYGNKSPEVVTQYARENTEFLLKKKADMIVVGCNAASSTAGEMLKKEFPHVPVFEVVAPAVREALRVTRNGRIGVIGTRRTIQSGAYQSWIRTCVGQACPLFVPLVEVGRLDDPATEEVARQYLRSFVHAGVDTLILGCTHYPFLKPLISRIMGRGVTLVDSAETVAREVAYWNVKCKMKNAKLPKHEFYVSKKTPRFQELAEKWLGMPITLKVAR